MEKLTNPPPEDFTLPKEIYLTDVQKPGPIHCTGHFSTLATPLRSKMKYISEKRVDMLLDSKEQEILELIKKAKDTADVISNQNDVIKMLVEKYHAERFSKTVLEDTVKMMSEDMVLKDKELERCHNNVTAFTNRIRVLEEALSKLQNNANTLEKPFSLIADNGTSSASRPLIYNAGNACAVCGQLFTSCICKKSFI